MLFSVTTYPVFFTNAVINWTMVSLDESTHKEYAAVKMAIAIIGFVLVEKYTIDPY